MPTPRETELIIQAAQLALQIGYQTIDEVAKALEDGKVTYWEGLAMGTTFAQLAMQLVPAVQQLVESNIDMRTVAGGLKMLHDRVADEPTAVWDW